MTIFRFMRAFARGVFCAAASLVVPMGVGAQTSGEIDTQTYILFEDTDLSVRIPKPDGGSQAYSACFGPGTGFRERTPGGYRIAPIFPCISRPPSPNDSVVQGLLSNSVAMIERVYVDVIKQKSRVQYAQPDNAAYAIPAALPAGSSEARVYVLRYDLQIPATVGGKAAFCLGEGSIVGKTAGRKNVFLIRKVEPCGRLRPAEEMEGSLIVLPEGLEADLRDISIEFGFRWGMLVVPYKFQLSGDREMRGGATVGPYIGMKGAFADLGVGLTPFVFAGAGNTSVRQVIGGTEVENPFFALSYGGGLMFSIDDKFNAGIVVGFDHVNDSVGYPYNDKPWVALQLGYDFTQK